MGPWRARDEFIFGVEHLTEQWIGAGQDVCERRGVEGLGRRVEGNHREAAAVAKSRIAS